MATPRPSAGGSGQRITSTPAASSWRSPANKRCASVGRSCQSPQLKITVSSSIAAGMFPGRKCAGSMTPIDLYSAACVHSTDQRGGLFRGDATDQNEARARGIMADSQAGRRSRLWHLLLSLCAGQGRLPLYCRSADLANLLQRDDSGAIKNNRLLRRVDYA